MLLTVFSSSLVSYDVFSQFTVIVTVPHGVYSTETAHPFGIVYSSEWEILLLNILQPLDFDWLWIFRLNFLHVQTIYIWKLWRKKRQLVSYHFFLITHCIKRLIHEVHSQQLIIKPFGTVQKSFRFCVVWYTVNILLTYMYWFLHYFDSKRKHQFSMKINAFFYLDKFFLSWLGEGNCNYWHLLNEMGPFLFSQSFEK